jgi:hypothetical protein
MGEAGGEADTSQPIADAPGIGATITPNGTRRTRERIRQIEAKALRKLKHPSRSRSLRSFLDNW